MFPTPDEKAKELDNISKQVYKDLDEEALKERCKTEHVEKSEIKKAYNVTAELTRLLVMTDAARDVSEGGGKVLIREVEPTVHVARLPHSMWHQVRAHPLAPHLPPVAVHATNMD